MKAYMPFVQISPDVNRAAGDRIAIMFASTHENDLSPCSRVIFVPRSVTGLAWETVELHDFVRVKLLVTKEDGEVQEHALGDITLPGVQAQVIRMAVSVAFKNALAAYLEWTRMQGEHVAGEDPIRAWSSPAAAAPTRQPSGRNMATWAWRIAQVALVISVVFAALWLFATMSPFAAVAGADQGPGAVQAAVAQNMAQDPASIQAQVNLTQETLRQMGIDPGRPGDLGCLAPQ